MRIIRWPQHSDGLLRHHGGDDRGVQRLICRQIDRVVEFGARLHFGHHRLGRAVTLQRRIQLLLRLVGDAQDDSGQITIL